MNIDNNEPFVDETVTFTSCAENSVKMVWDFGDGTTLEGETATHKYSQAGTYLVQLKSYSKKDKKVDKTFSLITVKPSAVKERFITKIVLKAFPPKKNDGSDWNNAVPFNADPGSERPYVDIKLKLSTSNWEYSTPTRINKATENDLPQTWNVEPSNLKFTNENWIIELNDRGNTLGGAETMQSWTINPYSTGANGIITLTSNSNSSGTSEIEVYYSEK